MQYRNEFLAQIDKITKTPDKLNPICPDDVKPLIRIVHDESTYYASCHQLYVWRDDENNNMYLNKKSFGQSIMVCQILLMNLMDICK